MYKKEAVESVYEEDTGDCIKLPLFYCRNNNLVWYGILLTTVLQWKLL